MQAKENCHLKGDKVVEQLLDRLQGALLAVRLGDTLGMPVETMTPAEILAATNWRGVTGFLDAIQTKYPDQANLKKGDPTDDWQFAVVVSKSLIACWGYSQEDMARRHVAAQDHSTIGWGETMRRGIIELETYFVSGGQFGRSFNQAPWPKPRQGAGNGIAMKIVSIPFAVALLEREHDLQQLAPTTFSWVDQLSALTHSHEDAMYTAYALARAISYCTHQSVQTLGDSLALLDWLDEELQMVDKKSEYYFNRAQPRFRNSSQAVVKQLRRLREHIGKPEHLLRVFPPTGLAIESVPYALGIFLTYPEDARKALLTCVNAGDDCDTTAAMCGSLLGANGGVEAFPEEWRNFRPDFQEPLDLGARLYETFSTLVLPKSTL
jgi:ADP-ribosylglycohydrolase